MFPSAFRFFQVAKVQSFLFTSFFPSQHARREILAVLKMIAKFEYIMSKRL